MDRGRPLRYAAEILKIKTLDSFYGRKLHCGKFAFTREAFRRQNSPGPCLVHTRHIHILSGVSDVGWATTRPSQAMPIPEHTWVLNWMWAFAHFMFGPHAEPHGIWVLGWPTVAWQKLARTKPTHQQTKRKQHLACSNRPSAFLFWPTNQMEWWHMSGPHLFSIQYMILNKGGPCVLNHVWASLGSSTEWPVSAHK